MLTVIGSINVDLVTTAVRIPDGGETVAAIGFATHQGGKGSNVARAAQRIANGGVNLVGAVGNDGFGNEAIKSLQEDGVDTSNIARRDAHTGVATILVDQQGENRILVFGGANDDVKIENLPAIQEAIDAAPQFLLMQNEIPLATVVHSINSAKPETCVVYNPSPINDDVPPSIWQNVGILIVNEIEAVAVCKQAGKPIDKIKTKEDALTATEILLSLGIKRAVIITLGPLGAVYANATGEKTKGSVDAVKAGKVVDTTGAGDTFTGALIAALGKQHWPVDRALHYASAASGIAVTRAGAASSMPFGKEVDELLASACS